MSWFQKKDFNPTVVTDSPSRTAEQTAAANQAEGNRTACLDKLTQIIDGAGKKNKGIVLKLYIENFKPLNDVFGYSYCEHLLEQIIDYLQDKTNTKVYRYIGVEFIVVLEGYSQSQGMDLADEIIEQFDHVWKVDGTDCLCSVQVGLCSYPGIPSDAEQMIKCLDAAVSRGIEIGHNQAVIYDTQLHNKMIRQQQIAVYLQTALDNKEIEVRYRPTYSLHAQKFTRAEFYMRIFIQGIGLIGAGEFLPIAEDSGQIRAVEYFALDQVGALIAELVAAGKDFESIALPISPILFLQEDFIDEVRDLINRHQIPAGKLALEFNEGSMVTAFLNIHSIMQTLHEIGVELIFNDFGSGFAGMSRLLELPVNTLKFERLFTWQLETNPKSGYIIESLTKMATNLGLKMIAEGVETENQVKLLTNYGCNYQQGFYYGPTVEKDILVSLIDTSLEESQGTIQAAKDIMKK